MIARFTAANFLISIRIKAKIFVDERCFHCEMDSCAHCVNVKRGGCDVMSFVLNNFPSFRIFSQGSEKSFQLNFSALKSLESGNIVLMPTSIF